MQLNFFTTFKEKHPNVSIELTSFICLKPWFVKHMKEWNTFYCHYHIELVEQKIGLNNMHSKISSIHANCACRCVDVYYPIYVQDVGDCYANQITFTGLVDLSSSILCPKPVGDEWHKRDCLMGDCLSYGINTLKVCPTEELLFVSSTV